MNDRNHIDLRADEIQDEITAAIVDHVPAEELNAQGFREACFKCSVLQMKLEAMEQQLRDQNYERGVKW